MFFRKIENLIFIDYENINNIGAGDLDSLTRKDKIYLYYSKNAKCISIEVFNKLRQGKINIETIACTIGKNAMDCVISTHLGALIYQYGKKMKYYIISKDNDYQSVVDFWKDIEIKRVKSILQVHNPDMVIEEVVKEPTVEKKTKSKSKKKHNINIRSMIGMLIKKIGKVDLNYIESIIKNGNKDTRAELLVKKYGQVKGEEYMMKLKPLFYKIDK